MRLGDVVNLKWENIDFDNGVIAFRQQKTQSEDDDATVIGLHPDFEACLKGPKVRALTGPIFPSLVFRGKLIEQAQKAVTGHSRGETVRHYTHIDIQGAKQAASMIPRLEIFPTS